MIKIDKIDRAHTLRYLGDKNVVMNSKMEELLNECEKELLTVIKPQFLYKTIELKDSGMLIGESIKKHLENCEYAVLMCAALGGETDKLIRTAQVTDMAKAVVLDAMASAAAEQVCGKADEAIAKEHKGKFLTWRFSPGYGDYPLRMQSEFLRILDAARKIGLCINDSFILTPTKSVTAIIGISDKPIENKRRGCAVCNLKESCKFRKAGTHCEF